VKVSDIVIKFLEDKNIKHVFTVSGGGCIHLIDSLGKSKKLDYICTHHEQAAAIAAEGYARLKEDIGACIVTTGPGGTNTLTGVLGAWLDSIPTIFISGQVSLSQIAEGTGCRQIGDQEFDIVSTVKSMTKYAVMIRDKKDILYELEKAYDIATSGRPGPVWIDVPLDIQGSYVEDNELKNYIPSIQPLSIIPKDRFKELILQAKKPLFIVGNGIRLSGSYKLFNNLLKKWNIPALTSLHSGVDCIDNTYEYYAGRIGILGNQSSNNIVQDTDLLIVLGSRLNVKSTGYNLNGFAPNAKIIYVDIDKYEINKHPFNIDLKIVTDLKYFLEEISDIEFDLDINDWRNKVKELRLNQKYYYNKHENLKDYASAYYFMSKLPKYICNKPIITSDGSAHVVTLQSYLLQKDQRMFTNVGCASMGYGLPAAIGACFVDKTQEVVCLEGDGSLQMNLQELQTIVHYQLPLKLIVINNEGYLSIKMSQASFFNGNEVASGKDTGVSFPDLEKIANAYGIPYVAIKNNDEIDSQLSSAFSIEGPVIIELFSYPYEAHEPKVVHKGVNENGKIIPGELTNMYISDVFNL